MLKDCDLIILSLIKWDGPVSSTPYALAKEFALNNRVFYINHPLSIKDAFLIDKSPGWSEKFTVFKNRYHQPDPSLPNLYTLVPCLTLPINFLPEGKFYDLLSYLNDLVLFELVKRLISDFGIKKYIFINAFDSFCARKFPANMLAPLRKIYHCLDEISEVRYTAAHGIRLEKEMSRNYDFVLASSIALKNKLNPYAGSIYYLPNGADTSLFNTTQFLAYSCPDELVAYRHKKIIGYTGSLEYRTNIELLNSIADSHPDKILCIVGPVYSEEAIISGLFDKPNVLYCGSKRLDQLPAYLRFMDCMIIPFKCNKLTSSIYPLKINEYLAAGKPVVSTGFSTEIRSFSDIIGIADDFSSFNHLINDAITNDSAELIDNRMFRASKNSWKVRVAQFWQILEEPTFVDTETVLI